MGGGKELQCECPSLSVRQGGAETVSSTRARCLQTCFYVGFADDYLQRARAGVTGKENRQHLRQQASVKHRMEAKVIGKKMPPQRHERWIQWFM